MRQAPARHDRSAARDDAGDALRGQRHIAKPHAGMDGEVVHALLGLLDQRVLEHLPVELVGFAIDLLQRLVDRHRPDRHRRIAENPVADVVDVAAGGEVHHRVGTPANRPHQFFDLFRRAGCDGGVADVGVDLHQEVAADDDRLEFRMVDVGRDDGTAARDLVANEFGRDEFGDFGAEILAVGAAFGGAFQRLLPPEVFPVRDVQHLLGDDSGAGEFELGDELARFAAIHRMVGGAERHQPVAACAAVVLGLHRTRVDACEAAFGQPVRAYRRQAGGKVNGYGRIGVDARCIVGAIRFLARRRVQRDLAERHADIGAAVGRCVDLARSGDRSGGDRIWPGGGFRLDRHGPLLVASRALGGGTWRFRECSRPYAGMTRFRFKGHRAAALGCGSVGISAPVAGLPSVVVQDGMGWGRCQTGSASMRLARGRIRALGQ